MKKLNNKGFAISAVLYTLLALILLLMVVMLAVIGSRKTTINKVNEDINSDIVNGRTKPDSNSNSNGGESNSNSDSNSNSNSNSNQTTIHWQKDILPGNYNGVTQLINDYSDINLTASGGIQQYSGNTWGYNVRTGPQNNTYNFKKGLFLSEPTSYMCFKTPANVKGTIWYVIGGGDSTSSVQLRLDSSTGNVLQTSAATRRTANSYSYTNMEANTTYCLVRNSNRYFAYIYGVFLYSPGGE